MKIHKQILGLLITSLLSVSAIAECSTFSCNNVYIDILYPVSSGNIYIGTSGDENVLGCSAPSGVYMTLPNGVDGRESIYSTLLAAFIADKKVNIRVNENSSNCEILYATVKRQ